MSNSLFFQNKICPKENKIQGKHDTREQIKYRKQTTEGCLLGSHDLPGLWLSKTNCWMHQSRELVYKLESLDQISQATFSWRLHLYLHPCLAMLKERDYQERLEWWLSLWPHVFLRSKERDAQVPGEGCSVSPWQAWPQGRGRGREHCNDVCGNQTFMKTAQCHHLITSMIGAHGNHSTEVT